MTDSATESMKKRLRVAKYSESPELLDFWRDHGRTWAQQEASFEDISRIAEIAKRMPATGSDEKTSFILNELQTIWRTGFEKTALPYGWDEMGDQLPNSAMVAFVEGAAEAWEEVKASV